MLDVTAHARLMVLIPPYSPPLSYHSPPHQLPLLHVLSALFHSPRVFVFPSRQEVTSAAGCSLLSPASIIHCRSPKPDQSKEEARCEAVLCKLLEGQDLQTKRHNQKDGIISTSGSVSWFFIKDNKSKRLKFLSCSLCFSSLLPAAIFFHAGCLVRSATRMVDTGGSVRAIQSITHFMPHVPMTNQ